MREMMECRSYNERNNTTRLENINTVKRSTMLSNPLVTPCYS